MDILKEEKKYISSLFKDKDIEKLICRYPVRETQVLTIIVNKCQIYKSVFFFHFEICYFKISYRESLWLIPDIFSSNFRI